MSYAEEEYLQLSGIQHFLFCRRQWALIHMEQQWSENYRTIDGDILHRNVHDSDKREKRGNLLIVRAMKISSARLGLSGECDAVELRRSAKGVSIFGQEGTFSVTPIEYKRGAPKEDLCDLAQLTAQAMCLEEMLCCEIPAGYLYYGETRHRLRVELTEELRQTVESAAAEMHALYARRYTPKGKRTKACNACSMKDLCLPVICGKKTATGYLQDMLGTME